jgi:hypothetical protein
MNNSRSAKRAKTNDNQNGTNIPVFVRGVDAFPNTSGTRTGTDSSLLQGMPFYHSRMIGQQYAWGASGKAYSVL